jgi:hypothetical protein
MEVGVVVTELQVMLFTAAGAEAQKRGRGGKQETISNL